MCLQLYLLRVATVAPFVTIVPKFHAQAPGVEREWRVSPRPSLVQEEIPAPLLRTVNAEA